VAYGSLEPHEAQQAAGLINLSRQLGGSFGIAILANYVTTHTQLHRMDLVSDVVVGSPATDERLRMLAMPFINRGLPPLSAQHAAVGLLNQQVNQQAAMLSYNDAWMLLLITFVLVSPAILLLRKPRGRAMAVDAH
jgi:DHA2 family multidrug resistance protein